MASEHPGPDDGPGADPFEAELVAYLDGELDPPSAHKVEARLAKDPAARARAAELKKSFDLLDYLPRPEPSPTFTTRTLDKLPAVKSGPLSPAPVPATHGGQKSVPTPVPTVSTSMPVPLETVETPGAPHRPRSLVWVAGVGAAVVCFAAVGYFASAGARPYLFPREKESDETKLAVDARVVEHLPLYAVADDLPFVVDLAKTEHFGDDPAVVYDSTLKVPHADVSDRPTGKDFEALARAFRALPPARQAEIVRLDQELYAKESKERDRLFRALEAYAVWLERLPESERRGVLAAATPGLRLGVIRDIRERQWLDALPPALRGKPELVQLWREDEATRRDRLAFVRQHAEAFAANKSPWPFDTELGRKEVLEFARAVFKPDDNRRCRLVPEELAEYRRTLQIAQREDAWAWFGLTVYELARQHPYLPEPENPKQMLTEPNDLPEAYARVVGKKGGAGWRIKPGVFGKWPDFVLEVHELPQARLVPATAPQLGPARLDDFKEPVRAFVTKVLYPKLGAEERRKLDLVEGKWPEYPQRLVEYARKHDLSVPGVTLPGSPKKWDATYGIRFTARPN